MDDIRYVFYNAVYKFNMLFTSHIVLIWYLYYVNRWFPWFTVFQIKFDQFSLWLHDAFHDTINNSMFIYSCRSSGMLIMVLYFISWRFSIYPSPEQDSDIQGIHIPISNNTGSLPDLTNLHFPSGLVTPLDSEDLQQQGYTQVSTHSNLSPTSAHQVLSSSDQTSGAIRRRGGPAPLVLQGQAGLSQLTQQMVQQVCGHSQVYAPC